MRLDRLKKHVTQIVILVSLLWFLVSLEGCDAFVRKFTRKPKEKKTQQTEMVLVPEEYKSQISKDEFYRKYFMYWKYWHTELEDALLRQKSHKKKIDCADQAIKNLLNSKGLLKQEKQKELDVYLERLLDLREKISKDIYGSNDDTFRRKAEDLRRLILRFTYNNVKDYLL